jgi:hypothetical protein
MSTKMNITDFESKVLNGLAEIRRLLEGSSSPSKKVKKERKPRDPDAPKNPWIVFTGKVRTALTNANLPAGKQCQQFASHLKNNFPNAYEMTEEEIVEAHGSWEAPPAKPTAASDAKVDDKPKKPVSRKAATEQVVVEVKPAVVSPPQPNSPPQPTTTKFRSLPFKGKKYLWDPESNGLWVAEKDGSKGKWAGLLSSDRKSIDTSAPNPGDADE